MTDFDAADVGPDAVTYPEDLGEQDPAIAQGLPEDDPDLDADESANPT